MGPFEMGLTDRLIPGLSKSHLRGYSSIFKRQLERKLVLLAKPDARRCRDGVLGMIEKDWFCERSTTHPGASPRRILDEEAATCRVESKDELLRADIGGIGKSDAIYTSGSE